MIPSINGMFNNQNSSLYVRQMQMQMRMQMRSQMHAQNQTNSNNSKNKGIVAKTGRNLSEMVVAIKQTQAMNKQLKAQNVFQKSALKMNKPDI